MATEKKQQKEQIVVMPSMPLTDENKQAIDILIQGVNIAQQKGVYTLQDAAYLNNAVTTLLSYTQEIKTTPENDKVF